MPPASGPVLPPADAPAPFTLDPSTTLSTNLRRLLEARLARALSPAEWDTVTSAALEALNLMQSRDLASRRRLLDASLLQALGTTTTAQLWASAVELVEDSDATNLSIASFGQSLVRVSGEIAAALFASAFGL